VIFASNVKRMLELIDQIDVTVESDYKLEVIPIKYGKVTDLFDTMNALISGAGGGGGYPVGGARAGTTTPRRSGQSSGAFGTSGRSGAYGSRAGLGGFGQPTGQHPPTRGDAAGRHPWRLDVPAAFATDREPGRRRFRGSNCWRMRESFPMNAPIP